MNRDWIEHQESLELFKTLLDANPIAICLSGFDGRYILANKAFVKYMNKAPEMVIGKTSEELGFYTNNYDRKVMMDQLLSKGYIENYEMTEIGNGQEYHLLVFATVVEVNNAKAILFSRYDITERKRRERELGESETIYRLMTDLVPYPITITDDNGRFSHANRAFLDRFNYKLEDIAGKTSNDLGFVMDEKSLQGIAQDNANGRIVNYEINLTLPNGENVCVLLSVQPVEINGKRHTISTAFDITEHKKFEQQLLVNNKQLENSVIKCTEELDSALEGFQATNEELKATNDELYQQREELQQTLHKIKEMQDQLVQTEKMASLGILTAGVAHEINNPINYIYNGTKALENFLSNTRPGDVEDVAPLLDAINTGISRIISIVKSLSKYSRKDDTTLNSCNIHEIIDNCLTMLFNQYKGRIDIVRDYYPGMPNIRANEGKLHQVFLNILNNGIQSIEREGKITIKTYAGNASVEVRITDTGKGISSENQKHIFDPFFTTKDPGKGTGLGLSITQKIVHEHEGSIQCKSQVGVGTEFFINLPDKS